MSTADPEKESPLVTANTILSILAADYPVDKLFYYVSDDGGSFLTFKAMEEAANFADLWVPFCRKHNIDLRNPESYFSLQRDPCKNKVMLKPPSDEPLTGSASDSKAMDLSEVDICLPMLVYVSHEKRSGYDHNKKVGAMNV